MELKPLFIMLAYNRLECSQQAFERLLRTVGPKDIEIHVVDNGSTDGTWEWLQKQRGIYFHRLKDNVGMPQAMNMYIKQYRQSGQHVITLDNDTIICTGDWLQRWLDALQPDIAMIGAHLFDDPDFCPRIKNLGPVWEMQVLTSNFILFNGEFLDRVGYYDVLIPSHTQGFTDLLFSEKARILGLRMICVPGVRASILISPHTDYPQELWDAFRKRADAICSGRVYTNEDGELNGS